MVTSTVAGLLPGSQGQSFVPFGAGTNGGASSVSGLTLAGGMTAGWGHGDGNIENPNMGNGTALDPYGGNPNWPIDRIGMLQTSQAYPINGKIYTLNFLYNPNQINVSFSTDPSNIPAAYTFAQSSSDPQFSGAASPSLTNSQSVSWSLIFDRTYDLTYGPNPSGNRGVLKDVGALYLLMGAFESTGAVPFSTLCDVVFGQTSDGDIWGFTGYITSANITYGIFRQNMIPSRCEVDLTMTAVYISPTSPPNGAAAGTGSSTPATATTSPFSGSGLFSSASATQAFG